MALKPVPPNLQGADTVWENYYTNWELAGGWTTGQIMKSLLTTSVTLKALGTSVNTLQPVVANVGGLKSLNSSSSSLKGLG